ncbi:MAG: Dam family site-specific DNA-(adenine-N6)-methyltransferase, partial [Planctomycetota bacterium]|nr:Dam family site-specific DNA-(adenine-N6)-methyltransferase [Planctomycetota bacterium]
MGKNSRAAPAVAPIVKWAGGKRQLLDALTPLLPGQYTMYCEPFLGGGALFFSQRPAAARVNDVNAELINLYRVVQTDVEGLIADLRTHTNDAACFYAVRDWDRDRDFYAGLSPLRRASRILYLNKTCYNGLFRVNDAGEFNTPFGRHASPAIVNEPALRAVGAYLREADIRFSSVDYAEVLDALPEGAFAYLDPPYHPVSETANFTGYTKNGFG